jgi:hypothetical protein
MAIYGALSLARHWMAWPEKCLGGAAEPDAELGQGEWGRGARRYNTRVVL